MNCRSLKATLLAGASIGLGLAPAAFGQDAEPAARERIVVTATKREQTIEEVPFSINAQTQDDIVKSGAQNIEDLSRNVAGLAIQNLGPGQSQVAIRGVSAGQIVRDQPGVKEQVGFYLDESVISLSLFNPDLDLFDLNRLETLRGPQGTLFGSGSIGGTIRYITNAPVIGEQSGAVEGNVNLVHDGDYGGHAKGVVNIPLSPTAALRASGGFTQYGGFIDGIVEGEGKKADVNSGDRFGGRVALLWEPTANLSITPRVVYQKIEMDGFNRQEEFNLFANTFTTTRPAIDLGEREQYLLLDEAFEDEFMLTDLTAAYEFGGATLTSVTSYTDREILVSRDASALTGSVSVDLGYPDAAVLLPSNLRDTTTVEQLTQEFRLSSNGEGPFQWLFGAFYADTDRFYRQRLPTPGYDAFTDATLGAGTAAATANGFDADSPYNSDLPYNIEQFAFFGEASYDITDRLTVTAGGRFYDFEETRRFLSGGLFSNGDDQVDTTSSDGFTPRFLASYTVSDSLTLNAQASQGFRLGGVNDPLNVPLCTPEDEAIFGGFQAYDDETLWNYEAGFKANTGRWTTNAAVYYTDIENLQVTLDAGSCSSRIVFNVPEAHSQGVEFEIGGELVDGFDVSFAASLLDAEFDSTVVDGSGNVLAGLREGNRLASVPRFSFATTARYTWPVSFANEAFVGGSFQWIDDRYTQPSDQENNPRSFVSGLPFGGATGTDATVLDLKLDTYSVLNLSAGLNWETLSLLAYINNVADENADLAFDRERGGRARLGFHVTQPRTVGVTVRKEF